MNLLIVLVVVITATITIVTGLAVYAGRDKNYLSIPVTAIIIGATICVGAWSPGPVRLDAGDRVILASDSSDDVTVYLREPASDGLEGWQSPADGDLTILSGTRGVIVSDKQKHVSESRRLAKVRLTDGPQKDAVLYVERGDLAQD